MAFCTKCGEPLADGAKFCSNCGTATSNATKDNIESRKQEWAGNVVKCPVCGEVIQSLTAICPACGFEVNSQKGASSVKQFIEEINEFDVFIAKDPAPPEKGWGTWKKEYRIAWIILNILTAGIPLVIYLVFPMMQPFLLPDKIPALSINEKRKAALIENITFPNEREAIVEAMMFIKSKMAFLVAEKFNRKTLYWADIWNTKAEQLNHRANIILKEDKVVETAYTDIKVNSGKLKKKLNVRAGIGFIVIGVYLILVSLSVFSKFAPEKKTEIPKEPSTNNTAAIQDEKQYGSVEDRVEPTSEAIVPTIDFEFTEEGVPSEGNDAGNNLRDTNSSLDNSVEVTIQNNEYLTVKEFAWFMSGEYLECAIVIHNPSSDTAIEYPTFRVTAYDKNNKVLGSEEQTLSIIYPQQDFVCYHLLFKPNTIPNKITVTLIEPDDYNITSASLLDHPKFIPLVGQNISINTGDLFESVTGELYNSNNYRIDSAMVTVIFRDKDGKIFYAEHGFIDKIPANGSIPFDIDINVDGIVPATCEVYGYPW